MVRSDRLTAPTAPTAVYAELHCHSAFSFLDGASLPEDLAAAAQSLGYRALALTDHNGLYGSMTFAQAAKPLGLQAITGAEVTLADGGGGAPT
jgi:error-prone DNA polymerase